VKLCHLFLDLTLSNAILDVLGPAGVQQQHRDFKSTESQNEVVLSFEQFVIFLINGTRAEKADELLSRKFHHNLHWIPYWRLCAPCHKDVFPNIVIKMEENMDNEVII
jgi:hypothetical protein